MSGAALLLAAVLGVGHAEARGPQPEKLLAPTGSASDRFGMIVAVSGDTMVVGAPFDAAGDNLGQGSAHVYRWTGTGWAFEATLLSADGAALDRFAEGVAVSGDTIVVGASRADVGANADQGAAYVFTRSGTTWTQQAKLIATGGAANDQFGVSVGISNSTIVVGSHLSEVAGNVDRGSAYVFSRSGATWTQQAQLTASDGAANDQFGLSVAIDGSSVIVGAYLDDVGANADQGSAYVYTRTGTTWTQQAKITAFDGGAVDQFGRCVAISGDRVAIGAPMDDVNANLNQGSAYVFLRTGTAWAVERVINASDGAAQDRFGRAVAIDGDTLAVGAFQDDVGANSNQGSIYIFQRSAATWPQQWKYTVSDGAADDQFGIALAVSGDTVVAGAPFDDAGAVVDQGSAWVFTRVGNSWVQPDVAQRLADDSGGVPGDQFGRTVAIDQNLALVGMASNGSGAPDAVFAYSRASVGSPWIERARIENPEFNLADRFGASIAISGTTAIIGAPGYDTPGVGADTGRAYVFTWSSVNNTWSLQAILTEFNEPFRDLQQMGSSVAISGNTVAIGAPRFLSNIARPNLGRVYIFTRSGTTWSLQTRINGPSQGSFFGTSVAISADSLLVGSLSNFGEVFSYQRSGTTWSLDSMLTRMPGSASSGFGERVAIDGPLAVVGADGNGVGGGGAYIFRRVNSSWNREVFLDFYLAGGVWRFGASVGVSALNSTVVIGAPGRDSVYRYTAAADGWQLRDRIDADPNAVGNFGESVADENGTLFIGATTANGKGAVFTSVRQESNFPSAINTTRNLTYFSIADAINGAQAGDEIRADPLAFGAVGVTDASARSVRLVASAAARWPSSAGLTLGNGSFLSAPVGQVVEPYGTLAVAPAAAADVNAPMLRLSNECTLTAGAGASLRIISGHFDSGINANTRLNLASATLRMEGPASEQRLEVMSRDVGRRPLGLDRTLAGQFPIGELWIGSAATTVRLVDERDNDGQGQATPEAIYVNTLRISSGCRLINPTIRIYYNTLINAGTVDVPANLIQIRPDLCPTSFSAPSFSTAGLNPIAAFSADLNGDGFADAIIANQQSNNLSVLLGNGDGTLQPAVQYLSGGAPGKLAIADFNADGRPDVAVACFGGSPVIHLGNGDGTLAPPLFVGLSNANTGIAVGDFNGDSRPDLAVTRGPFNHFAILFGNGDGTFGTPQSLAIGYVPNGIAVAEVTGDASADVLVCTDAAGPSTGEVLLMPGNGNGTIAAPVSYPSGPFPYAITTGDFNGDSLPDLAVVNHSGTVTVRLGYRTPAVTFGDPASYFEGDRPFGLATGDFNTDGKTDFLAANYWGNNISVLLNTGDAAGIAQQPSSRGACQGATVTFSVIASGSGPFNYQWRKDGAPINAASNPSAVTPTLTLSGITAADYAGYACVVSNGCGGSTSRPAELFNAADFNGDGFVDFFDYDDYVLCYETGTCPPRRTADFNGDGFLDFFDYDEFVFVFETGC